MEKLSFQIRIIMALNKKINLNNMKINIFKSYEMFVIILEFFR